MKTLLQTSRMLAAFGAAILMVRSASAATTIFVGTNGVSANTNWSTAANFIDGTSHNPETPANNAANFNFDTAVSSPGIVTVNVDGGYGTPGSGTPQAWSMIFGQTNGYHTVLIQPGITLEMIAANGTIGGGGLMIVPTSRTSGGNTSGSVVASGPYTNYTTFTGSGGTLLVNGQLHVEAQSSAVNNHYTIMDMQGLGMYVHTNTSLGTPARFLLLNGGTRSQGIIYLAQTNIITPRGDIQIGYLSTSSNSLPIGLYLGKTNLMLTDPALGNGNVLNLAIQGCTNGFMMFNPAFVGGPTKPTAYLSGAGGTMATVNIANAKTAFVPSYGIADFTGGQVTWLIGNLQMGQAGTGATNNATGVLTFDDGTVTVSTATVGWQTSAAGGVGTGIINIGTNGIFQATSGITLAATTGTVTAGDTGTININGGSLVASGITVGTGGTGTITMTNHAALTLTGTAGTPAVPLTSVSITNSTLSFATSLTSTNLVVGTLTTSGANTINIISAPPLSSVPTVIKLIAYSGSIGGAGYDFTLGSLPPLCAGSLSNDTANSSVDLVLTSGPLGLIWDGDVSGDWNTSVTNWFAAGPNFYADGDYVIFQDGATTGSVNLTAAFVPGGVTVTNNSLPYSFTGGGSIGGSIGLLKQGTGTLIIDNSGNNSYAGITTISNGTVQIGNNDANGNLPGAVLDNGALVLDRSDGGTFGNTISGTGSVTYSGGNTLQLSGGNTFSGNLTVNNNSTLQLGSASAVGAATGSLTVASGSTLDINGNAVVKSITVSGTGVGGNGALTDNGGSVYDSATGLATNITLAGDTTFSFPTRWDLGQTANGSVLNSGGHPYNLTLASSINSYYEWRNLALDAALGNINVTSGTLGIVGSTTLGSPSSTLTVTSGAGVTFYNAAASVNVNKQWDLQNGAVIQNGGGATVLSGPMTLEPGLAQFNVGGTSLTLSNVLSGSGQFYANGGSSPLILGGASPLFTGGVSLYTGSLTLNGLIGSGVTALGGTTVSGTGTANGLMDISGALLPGSSGVAGTLNAAGGLTLEGGATLTMDLSAAGTVGGGVNDLIVVTGDLAAGGNPLYINPIGASLASSYTLLTYTGNATTFFNGAQTAGASRYVFTLTNVTTTTPKQVNLLVSGSGGGPASLVWNNAANSGMWDTQVSLNWSNQITHAATDYFFTQDSVTFDDSIISDANPTTTIQIPNTVVPNIVTNNSTTNYTFNGAGKISGGGSIVKLGSSTLTINTTNDFTGSVKIQAGTVVQGTNNAFGSATGTLIVTNSGTADLNGFAILAKPVVLSGAGVNANGAIINNGGPIYDDGHGLTAVTLAGDATIGEGGSRMDLGNSTGGTLSTGGHPYNLSVTGVANSSYSEFDALTIDPALANINILGGELGLKGMTSIGNPASTVTIFSGGRLTFWGGTGYAKNIDVKSGGTILVRYDGPNFDFGMTLEGGSTFASVNQPKVFTAPVSLTGLVNFQIGNASCTFSNVISGTGGFYVNNYDNNPLIFTATNTYSGPTLLSNSGSGLVLALVGNGSISSSTNIGLTSGTILDVSGRTDHTLTLTGVQTMEGSGAVLGNLTANAGSTLEPGYSGTGTLTVTNTATLNGVTAVEIGGGANNLLNATNITYGGTLSLSFTAGTLSGGNSFKLFNAALYSGAFATLVPSTPGAGLTWDTSQLTVSGTLRVSAPPQFGSITVSGTTLTLTGTGGTPNGTYHVKTSTDAAAKLNTWTPAGSGSFDNLGHFNFTGSVNPAEPQRFYILVEP